MFVRSIARVALVAALVAPMGITVSACGGGGKQEAKTANVQPGEMPVGGGWSGVYYSPLYGYLHLIQEGDSVNGAWRTNSGEAWGEMQGKVEGDVMRFTWTEHKIGMVGANAVTSGNGYFRYTAPRAGESHELKGEWGLGVDEAGNAWDAVKQANMKPNPRSVRPDESEARVGGGEWDEAEADTEGGSSPEEDEAGFVAK
jgi:hypothetical protein